MILAQRVLFSLYAAASLAIGISALTGVVDFGLEHGAWVIGALWVANGVAFVLTGWLSLKGKRWMDFAAIGLVVFNAVASLADELGALDVAAFAFNCLLLGLLITNTRRSSSRQLTA